jgi:hypothetical protein
VCDSQSQQCQSKASHTHTLTHMPCPLAPGPLHPSGDVDIMYIACIICSAPPSGSAQGGGGVATLRGAAAGGHDWIGLDMTCGQLRVISPLFIFIFCSSPPLQLQSIRLFPSILRPIPSCWLLLLVSCTLARCPVHPMPVSVLLLVPNGMRGSLPSAKPTSVPVSFAVERSLAS